MSIRKNRLSRNDDGDSKSKLNTGESEIDNADEKTSAEPGDIESETETEEVQSRGSRIKQAVIKAAVLILFVAVIFIGLTVMLYPSISNYINNKNASFVINDYAVALSGMSDAQCEEIFAAAEAYNRKLSGIHSTITDAFSAAEDDGEKTDEYWNLLDVSGNGVMGYIEIEKLSISLPIYHGTSEGVLAVGAGHIHGTSLPVGKPDTHAVISAHTGLPRAKLFTGIDTLKEGDTFQVHVLNKTFTYSIDQILVVLPHEIEALNMALGEDYITLVTCTPYGINTHRLLVRGTRIETQTDPTEQPVDQPDRTVETIENDGFFEKIKYKTVELLADIVEGIATGMIKFAEWGMDLFGVEY